MPKLPPMSPATTRTLLSGTLSTLLRQLGAEAVRALQRGVDRVVVLGRIVVADAAARLHGGGGDAVDHQVALDNAVGAGEGRIGRGLVAFEMDEADIVRAIVPHAAARPGLTASAVETIAGSGS